MQLYDVFPTEATADLTDVRGVDSETESSFVETVCPRADFPDLIVGKPALRYPNPARGSSMALPVIRVFLRGPCSDVLRVDAGRVPTEMTGVAPSGSRPSEQDQYRTVHSYRPVGQPNVAVPALPRPERRDEAVLRRVRLKIRERLAEPNELHASLDTSRQRISIRPVPAVVGLAQPQRVVRSGAVGNRAQFRCHGSSIPNVPPCCLIAALVNLPT
jgi:hypothetical protein